MTRRRVQGDSKPHWAQIFLLGDHLSCRCHWHCLDDLRHHCQVPSDSASGLAGTSSSGVSTVPLPTASITVRLTFMKGNMMVTVSGRNFQPSSK